MNHVKDLLNTRWASLGISFNIKEKVTLSPEEIILETVKNTDFESNRKIFSLMLLWLNKYHDLVHVELLKNKLDNLSDVSLKILCGYSLKMVKLGDLRWNAIINTSKKRMTLKTSHTLEMKEFIERCGADKEFKQFKINIAALKPEDEKKLYPRKRILRENFWLRNRLLFGANFRADIYTLIENDLVENPNQASKYLSCSRKAAYKNWNEIIEAKELVA